MQLQIQIQNCHRHSTGKLVESARDKRKRFIMSRIRLQPSTMEPANTNTRANISANTIIQKHINTNMIHPAPLHWHQKQPKNCRKYGNGSSSPLHRVTMVRANIRIHIEKYKYMEIIITPHVHHLCQGLGVDPHLFFHLARPPLVGPVGFGGWPVKTIMI